jgi:hypothetical protein
MEAYAYGELHVLPSYLQAVRDCCEQMWQNATTMRKKLAYQANLWTNCVNMKFEQANKDDVADNLHGQQLMRQSKLIDILREGNHDELLQLAMGNGKLIFSQVF